MWGGPPQTSLPSLADLLSAAGLCLVLGLVRDVIGALWASFQRDPAGAVYVSRAGVAGAGAGPGYTAPRRPEARVQSAEHQVDPGKVGTETTLRFPSARSAS